MTRPGTRRIVAWAAVAVGALVVAGCGSGNGLPDSATEQGDTVTEVWRIFLFGAIAVAGLIWVLVLTSIVRFRGRADDGDDAIPVQRQYRTRFEIVYTAIPLLIVLGLFALTMVADEELTSTDGEPDLEIEVIGFQWQWQFRYDDHDIVISGTPEQRPELVLPIGATVRFDLVADDVIHSFWVPEFLEKRDLIPGVENQIDIEVKESGAWVGRCAEYCGLDHWKMTFDVRAVSQAEFDDWVSETAAKPQPVVAGATTTTTAPDGSTDPQTTTTEPAP